MRSSSWIAIVSLGLACAGCGGGDSPGGMTQNTGPVTIQTVQAAVFSPSCAVSMCHIGGGAPFGLDLSQGQALGNLRDVASSEMPQFYRVERFEPDDSYLYMKVIADPRISGDPMPAQGSLTASQISLLRQWIEQGAN